MSEIIMAYAIYDNKGDRYDTPFFAFNDLFAERRFVIMSRDKNTPLGAFTKDFTLFRIGSFNVISGVLKEDKHLVIDGKQIGKEIEEDEISNAA